VRYLGVLLIVAASQARGQQSGVTFPERLAADTRVTLTRLADSARSLGIPAEAIAAKAAEGVLKGADDARILRAVRSLVADLGNARAVLPGANASVLTAAASALHAGASARTLRELSDAAAVRPATPSRDADLALALISVADLAASGVSAERAGSAVAQLLRRGAPDSAIDAFRAGVARDVIEGRAPDQALSTRMRALRSPRSP